MYQVVDCMVLENEKCCIKINIDETYTVDSMDNRHYDVVLNPCNYKRSDLSKTLSIHIDLFLHDYSIALIGPFYTYDSHCATLDNETLTVLQDNTITQLKITEGTIIRHVKFDCWFGCNDAIYKVEQGYVIVGEIEITMLDFDFTKKWSFVADNVVVSSTFKLQENSMCLYDIEDNYYEVDFDGNLF